MLRSLNVSAGGHRTRRRAWALPAAVATAGSTLATCALVALPGIRFAYAAPGIHVAIEMLVSAVAAFAAFVVYGRSRYAERSGGLLLFLGALLVLAVGNLLGGVLPSALDSADVRHIGTWAPLVSAVLGGVGLVAAVVEPARRAAARIGLRGILLGTAVALAAEAFLLLAVPAPSTGVPTELSPAASARPLLVGSPALLALQGFGIALYATAGALYISRADAHGDAFGGRVGVACLLLAFARVQYFLFPSIDLHWLYFGDLWRVAGFLLILAAAVAEANRHWRRLGELAVLEERRRIARDLHDGLAQELAFLAVETRGEHARAAQRALDESRRAIAALTEPLDTPLEQALERAAEEIGMRHGCRVVVSASSQGCPPPPAVREEILRIAREAIGNAARHSGADRIDLRLEIDDDRLSLVVADDGCGFDLHAGHAGHGLTSMQERAHAIDGLLRLDSTPGGGARIELLVGL